MHQRRFERLKVGASGVCGYLRSNWIKGAEALVVCVSALFFERVFVCVFVVLIVAG